VKTVVERRIILTPVLQRVGMKEENSTRISIDWRGSIIDYYCCVSHHFVTYQQNLIQSASITRARLRASMRKVSVNCKEKHQAT